MFYLCRFIMLYSESSTVLTIMIYECRVTKVISYTFCSTRCKCFTLLTSARKPSATNPWCEFIDLMMNRVPTRTGKTGKPGKMGRHFPVREKSGNFEQTGKVRENHTKHWKTEGISEKIICYFSMIFK